LKTIRLIPVILVIFVVTLSCTLLQRPVVTEGPSFEVWTPTSQLPVEPTVMAGEPTAKVVEPTVQPVYARAQIGTYLTIWVTYDPAIWNAAQWVEGTNQANEPIQALFHKTAAGCSLHDNLGHGVPPSWSWATYTRDIGGVIFQIDQWTETTTNNPVLVIYQYPSGDQTNTSKRLELEPGTAPYDCINAADGVIGLSLTDITQ
jgi:hypothetical protein